MWLDKIASVLGDFTDDLRGLRPDTKILIGRLLVRGRKSGDLNRYLRERLTWIFAAEDGPKPPPEWTLKP